MTLKTCKLLRIAIILAHCEIYFIKFNSCTAFKRYYYGQVATMQNNLFKEKVKWQSVGTKLLDRCIRNGGLLPHLTQFVFRASNIRLDKNNVRLGVKDRPYRFLIILIMIHYVSYERLQAFSIFRTPVLLDPTEPSFLQYFALCFDKVLLIAECLIKN